MKTAKYIVLALALLALLATGCMNMKPAAEYSTEDAVFALRNGTIEVKATKDLSGLEVFLKADVRDDVTILKDDAVSVVNLHKDGTVIAVATKEGYISEGETVMRISGVSDLKSLGIETEGVYLEQDFEPQTQTPVDGIYVEDNWAQSGGSHYFIVGAKDVDPDYPVVGFDFVIEYNTTHISTITNVEILQSATIEEIDTSTSGIIDVQVAYSDENAFMISDVKNLVKVNFTAKNVKTTTDIVFTTSDFIVYTGNDQDPHDRRTVDANNGVITIGDPKLLGDFNLDGVVNIDDLTEFSPYYRTSSGDGEYNALYDIGPAIKAYAGSWADIYTETTQTGSIDLYDLVILAQNWQTPKPDDFDYVTTLDELNAAIASDQFDPIVFGADITGTPDTVTRGVDINLNGYTLTGNLNYNTTDSGYINLYAGEGGKIDGDLTVNAPNATFNNYANVTGTITITDVSGSSWNEHACNNMLVWNASNKTLYIHCGAAQLTLNVPGNVIGGSKVSKIVLGEQINVINVSTGNTYDEIQPAIDEANNKDIIVVNEGTYNENLVIDSKDITLLSSDGREVTTIEPLTEQTNAIELRGTTTGVQIGGSDQGFTIVGATPTNQGVETAAVYMKGSHSGTHIEDNEIVAGGDSAILSEWGAAISDLVINGNTISGKTFVGDEPAGQGTDEQFSLFNVPRSLVYFGNKDNKSNITFTNNQITGIAGGLNENNEPQGNQVVNIDANDATITGNYFSGDTAWWAASLRARGTDTVIEDNEFVSGSLLNLHVSLGEDAVTGGAGTVANANTFDRATYIENGNVIYTAIQHAVDVAETGNTIDVKAGTYNEDIFIDNSLTLQTDEGAIIDGGIELQVDNITVDGFEIINGGELSGSQKAGIYIIGGTQGHSILDNTIKGRGKSETGWPGIMFGYNTSNITVNENTIEDWYQGTYINPSSNITFENNLYQNNNVGIGSDGISDITLTGNDFSNNEFEAWGASDVGSNVIAHKNKFDGNGAGINHYSGSEVIDATENWWGHETGPSGVGGGLGDAVSEKVDFTPWHTDSDLTELSTWVIEASSWLLTEQHEDGWFPWVPGGGTTYNTQGPTAYGLLMAYKVTEIQAYLDAAVKTGDYMISTDYYGDGTTGVYVWDDCGEPRFATHDPLFLEELSSITGDSKYEEYVNTWFWSKLTAGTYGGDKDIYDFLQREFDGRTSQPNIIPYDLCAVAIAADIAGETTIRDAVLEDGIFYSLENLFVLGGDSDVTGLAGAIWASAYTGYDLNPESGDLSSYDSTSELAGLLSGWTLDNDNGAWLWSSNADSTDETNGELQSTAFALRALSTFDETTYSSQIDAGMDFMESLQEDSGALLSWIGGGINVQVNGDALASVGIVEGY